MPVTDAEIRTQVRRLRTIFATSKSEDELVQGWRHVLGESANPRELDAACTDYARSGERYFPTPGKILQAILATRPASDQSPIGWDQLQEGSCPTCGAVLQLAADPIAQAEVWDHYRDPKTTRWTGGWRKRTKDDPPPRKRYVVLHDARAHARSGIPAIGRAQ